MAFADRSIQNLTTQMGYDTGVALHAREGNIVGTGRIFTSAGMNLFRTYIPETLGFPLIVARAGYDEGEGDDLFSASPVPGADARARKAFYFNGYYTKDSLVGGNTILNERLTQLSMLPEDSLLSMRSTVPQFAQRAG